MIRLPAPVGGAIVLCALLPGLARAAEPTTEAKKDALQLAAEIDRLTKVIGKNESDIGKLRGKLANESFVKNAKPELVEADRARLAELEAQTEGLRKQLERVRRLGGN